MYLYIRIYVCTKKKKNTDNNVKYIFSVIGNYQKNGFGFLFPPQARKYNTVLYVDLMLLPRID